MSSWGRLYRSLRDLLPPHSYRLGMSLEHVEQDADGVTAVLADGRRERGDILVGADGLRSTVREQFLPEVQPSYAGYVAWRATLEESEIAARHPRARSSSATPSACRKASCSWPIRCPDATTRREPGRRAYNIVWYRPTDPDHALDRPVHRRERALPWHLDPAAADPAGGHRRRSRRRPMRWWRRRSPRSSRAREQPFFQPIFDLESPRTVFGRVALLGDAAFVARPHVGAGVTKAALDAAEPRRCAARRRCRRRPDRYQRQQVPFGRGLVRLGPRRGRLPERAAQAARSSAAPPSSSRDIRDVLDAHNARSENLHKVLTEARRATESLACEAQALRAASP